MTGKRTFGSYRAEVFASDLTMLILLGVSAYVVIEALSRIGSDPEVSSTLMIVVGGIGLLINLIVMLMLRSGAARECHEVDWRPDLQITSRR